MTHDITITRDIITTTSHYHCHVVR